MPNLYHLLNLGDRCFSIHLYHSQPKLFVTQVSTFLFENLLVDQGRILKFVKFFVIQTVCNTGGSLVAVISQMHPFLHHVC